ncbi:FxLYD domain-containing protein [Butyrivibrio sp. AE3004]|uniref:FxLYD domain-containing protein n=1 Tax=Butyrivibrio sp. AE3004 TaxID=1506994 RepID=UPI000493BE81|nr:FxLYD domain-containing protein [Butyrivibrio sp. AE3004]
MKYALTTFALIVTLLGGFIFGAYYMYRKKNPATVTAEQVNEAPSAEDVLDNSDYYDSDGNWIFKYGENENWDGKDGSTVVMRDDAAENIDYRITGTNLVYEDDGLYSGFHAVVTVENVGTSNLYLGKESVFNIEDRYLKVVDSYDFVRAVPDIIAPGEKGYFYVPYGHIKTREDSVTIDEDELKGDSPRPGEANSADTPSNGEDVNAIDIDELEKALIEEGLTTSSLTIKKDAEHLMAGADTTTVESADKNSGGTELLPSDESSDADNAIDDKNAKDADKKTDDAGDKSEEAEADTKENADKKSDEAAAEGGENADSTSSEDAAGKGNGDAVTGEDTEAAGAVSDGNAEPEKVEYPGLSLYRVNEYFIMPDLDVKKCVGEPRKDFDISNIMYGSNASGYFTLSADVTNSTDKNIDYVPVTVIALDRRGNAIAAGADSITDFYKGAKKSFGVSYILTREQRSNIVQCVIYAREVVNAK